MPTLSATNVTGPVAYHAEGPVWWPGWGGLRYVDMLAGDLLTLRPDGGVDRLQNLRQNSGVPSKSRAASYPRGYRCG